VSPTSARRSTFTERRWARRAAIATTTLTLAAIVCWVPHVARGGDAPVRTAVLELSREVDELDKRLELATGSDFYVLVHQDQRKLSLMLRGAVLREYPIEALQVGSPRVVFRNRHLADDWQGRIWTEGTLVPTRDRERIEIIPPDSTAVDSTRTFTPPPLPEELYPVPKRYRVRFAGGLSIEVRPHELDSTIGLWGRLANGMHVWARDVRAALRRTPEDTVRLRIVMQPEHAASFYRALPPSTRMLVLPRS
jgi:hypothetical protein